jgi:hypothetical protein
MCKIVCLYYVSIYINMNIYIDICNNYAQVRCIHGESSVPGLLTAIYSNRTVTTSNTYGEILLPDFSWAQRQLGLPSCVPVVPIQFVDSKMWLDFQSTSAALCKRIMERHVVKIGDEKNDGGRQPATKTVVQSTLKSPALKQATKTVQQATKAIESPPCPLFFPRRSRRKRKPSSLFSTPKRKSSLVATPPTSPFKDGAVDLCQSSSSEDESRSPAAIRSEKRRRIQAEKALVLQEKTNSDIKDIRAENATVFQKISKLVESIKKRKQPKTTDAGKIIRDEFKRLDVSGVVRRELKELDIGGVVRAEFEDLELLDAKEVARIVQTEMKILAPRIASAAKSPSHIDKILKAAKEEQELGHGRMSKMMKFVEDSDIRSKNLTENMHKETMAAMLGMAQGASKTAQVVTDSSGIGQKRAREGDDVFISVNQLKALQFMFK